jgi:hypothetical protein
LLCDFVVLGILVFSAWNLLGKSTVRFDLADMFTVTTAIALTFSFHAAAWGRDFELSKCAIDLGVFSAFMITVPTVQAIARRLFSKRASGAAECPVPDERGSHR